MSESDLFAFTKKGGALVPSDALAADAIVKVKEGREVLIALRRPRNVSHHRKLFALLHLVMQNTENRWPSVDVLLDDLKLATGLYEQRFSLVTGKPYMVAKSISFSAMSQDTFAEWYTRAVEVLAAVLGISPAELEGEVDQQTERRAA